MTESTIWQIGELVGVNRGKPPKARADFAANTVVKAALAIEHDPVTGIPDHVNLTGWPKEKDEQKFVAQTLCAGSTLILAASKNQN